MADFRSKADSGLPGDNQQNEKLLASKQAKLNRLINNPDFNWAFDVIAASGTGGELVLNFSNTGRLKRVSARIGRDLKE